MKTTTQIIAEINQTPQRPQPPLDNSLLRFFFKVVRRHK